MKPYYQDDAVTIYNADCREILAGGGGLLPKVDLVLTDPPYGVGNKPSGIRKKGRASKAAYGVYKDTDENHRRVVVPAIKTCIKLFPRVILTPGIKHLFRFPKATHIGTYQYGAGSTVMSAWGPVLWQPILFYGKDPLHGKLIPDSIQGCNDHGEPGSENGHPCPKPMKSWKRLLVRVSLEGETILDPFMGSGTTLKAAKELGRKAIGIELEERYCEIAVRSLRQEVLL